MKNSIIKFFLIYIFSLIIFKELDISLLLYLFLLAIGWGVSLFCYSNNKSNYYQEIVAISILSNFLAFISVKSFYADTWFEISNIFVRLLIGIILLEVVYVILNVIGNKNNSTWIQEGELFPEHKYDLDRLKALLRTTSIIGINSLRGSGKSFIVNYFTQAAEIKEQYFVVKIEALSYQFDEVDKILVHKLDEVLRENAVFSIYSEEMKAAVNTSILGRILYYFFQRGDSSTTSTFESLHEELSGLSKKVLIIYEDLERVERPEIIKRIFSISEQLSGDYIQIIYEFDGAELDRQEIDRAYREKYIPLEMNLTPINYQSIVNVIWNELGMKEIDKEIDMSIAKSVREAVQKIEILFLSSPYSELKIKSFKLNKNLLTIRRVRIFLLDLKAYLLNHAELKSDEIHIVIAFYFLKYFMYDQYQKLQIEKPIEETFLIPVDGGEYNLKELGESITDKDKMQKIQNALNNPEIAQIYSVYCLFNVDTYDYCMAQKHSSDMTEYTLLHFLKAKEHREKINRLIWNLLSNGESEYTDIDVCVKMFIEEVLNASETHQQKAWKKYMENLYYGKVFKNNISIFKMGHNFMVDMSKAMYLANVSANIWGKFLSFLSIYWNGNNLNIDFIKIIRYISLEDIELFIGVLRLFIRLEPEGHFNDVREYYWFLSKCIKAIWQLGICRSFEIELFVMDVYANPNEELKTHIIKLITEIIEQLRAEKDSFDNKTFRQDIDVIVRFLDKNIKIIKLEKAASNIKPKLTVDCHSERINREEFDKIKKMVSRETSLEEKERKFKAAVSESYEARKISYLDVRDLREEIFNDMPKKDRSRGVTQ